VAVAVAAWVAEALVELVGLVAPLLLVGFYLSLVAVAVVFQMDSLAVPQAV
jgi:hypothetical protein